MSRLSGIPSWKLSGSAVQRKSAVRVDNATFIPRESIQTCTVFFWFHLAETAC